MKAARVVQNRNCATTVRFLAERSLPHRLRSLRDTQASAHRRSGHAYAPLPAQRAIRRASGVPGIARGVGVAVTVAASIRVPQAPQNSAAGATSFPHDRQACMVFLFPVAPLRLEHDCCCIGGQVGYQHLHESGAFECGTGRIPNSSLSSRMPGIARSDPPPLRTASRGTFRQPTEWGRATGNHTTDSNISESRNQTPHSIRSCRALSDPLRVYGGMSRHSPLSNLNTGTSTGLLPAEFITDLFRPALRFDQYANVSTSQFVSAGRIVLWR